MSKFLLVEDDIVLAETLESWFAAEGHILEIANTGEDALQMLRNFQFEVILMDWDLAGISGLEVLRRYRSWGGRDYVIFLTGKGDLRDKEQGLEIGADDYMVKPFHVRELSARIRSLLRRPAGIFPARLQIGDVAMDPNTRSVSVRGESIYLMPKESALLEFLMRNPNRSFGSSDLLNAVWRSDTESSAQTIRSWIRNLRIKLAAAGLPDFIKTNHGSGYMIELKA